MRSSLWAAEYIYSKSQRRDGPPISRSERNDEAIAFCRGAVTALIPPAAEAPSGLGLAIRLSGGSTREALALYRAAVNSTDFGLRTRTSERSCCWATRKGAWRAGEEMRTAAGGRPGRAPEADSSTGTTSSWNLPAWLDATVADAEACGVGLGAGSAGHQSPTSSSTHDRKLLNSRSKRRGDPHDLTIAR